MKWYIYLTFAAIYICGCNKSEFLDVKPDQSDVMPRTIEDYRAILDQDRDVNGMGVTGRGPVPGLGEMGADNYFLPDGDFNRLRPQFQNYYLWNKEVYLDYPEHSWNWPYLTVFYANVVLDGLEASDYEASNEAYRQLVGEALFTRAHAFYQLAQVFVPPFDEAVSNTPLGLPLRLSADINEKLERSTVEETYALIQTELEKSLHLLGTEPLVKTRPSKQAVYGLLARLYLTMRQYETALVYADSCLSIQSALLDYNKVNSDLRYPFSNVQENPEIIYLCHMASNFSHPISNQFARIDTTLYKSYAEGDLRKVIYFHAAGNGNTYKGSYTGNTPHFAGIATDEMYLIKAECLARKGELDAAMKNLNHLLKARWDDGKFVPISAGTASDALAVILEERRKELIFRGHRWTDLRRLNQENYGIMLVRKLGGTEYILAPRDNRYTWPIPDEVISFHLGMPQNPR